MVIDGSMSAEDALSNWPNIDDPTDSILMQNAWHSLYHYYTDDDIRAKEPEYEASQLAQLRSFRDKLISCAE